MRGFVAIFRREFVERHRILYVAVLASLFPFVLPAIHKLGPADVASLRGGLALVIAGAFALGLLLALGLTAIVPRIASRRIGFDLARPVSTSAIWFGTLAATTALAVASASIVGLPAWLAGAKGALADLSTEPGALSIVVSLLFVLPGIFGLFHALAVVLRSRTARIALDAAAVIVAIVGTRAAFARLPLYTATGPWLALLIGLTCAGIVALVAGGSASVARGRTDLRAAHRALSTVVWSVSLVAVLVANVYAAWVLAAKPQALAGSPRGLWVRSAGTGPWIDLSGQARGADARFIYDTSSGRFARLQTPDWRGPTFSRDGRRAVWIERSGRGGPFPVRTWRLDDPSVQPVTTRLTVDTYPSLMELSADGSRLATWENGVLAIHDVDAQRTLMSARLVHGDRESLYGSFASPSVFRVIRSGEQKIDLLEADLSARTLVLRVRIDGFENHPYFAANHDFGRIAILDEGSGSIALYDGATGQKLAALPEASADSRRPFFVADGRLCVSEKRGTDRWLRVFSSDGEALRSIPLPSGAIYRGGEVAPGQLCIAFGDPSFHYELWLVGLDDGSLRKVAEGLRPIFLWGTSAVVGSDATKLFFAGPGDNVLVRFDPLTGERRTLIGQP
jgi:hypothetical protein